MATSPQSTKDFIDAAELADRADRRRFVRILIAVVVGWMLTIVALYVWNAHREKLFRELAAQRVNREVFLERVGRPDKITFFGGEECWLYEFNRNPYASACFDPETGEFNHSSHSFINVV